MKSKHFSAMRWCMSGEIMEYMVSPWICIASWFDAAAFWIISTCPCTKLPLPGQYLWYAEMHSNHLCWGCFDTIETRLSVYENLNKVFMLLELTIPFKDILRCSFLPLIDGDYNIINGFFMMIFVPYILIGSKLKYIYTPIIKSREVIYQFWWIYDSYIF